VLCHWLCANAAADQNCLLLMRMVLLLFDKSLVVVVYCGVYMVTSAIAYLLSTESVGKASVVIVMHCCVYNICTYPNSLKCGLAYRKKYVK